MLGDNNSKKSKGAYRKYLQIGSVIQMAIINTTIKLRNDQVSSFEDANTSLQQGEIAIGFLSNGNAIMRVGNSDDSTWESASKLQLESQVDLTEICLQILA